MEKRPQIRKKFSRGFFRVLEPGLLLGAADDDPSGTPFRSGTPHSAESDQ